MSYVRCGLTDLEQLYQSYMWEIEALMEGAQLRRADDYQQNADMAMWLRYALNEKRVKMTKMFNLTKREQAIREAWSTESKVMARDTVIRKRALSALRHFSKGG